MKQVICVIVGLVLLWIGVSLCLVSGANGEEGGPCPYPAPDEICPDWTWTPSATGTETATATDGPTPTGTPTLTPTVTKTPMCGAERFCTAVPRETRDAKLTLTMAAFLTQYPGALETEQAPTATASVTPTPTVTFVGVERVTWQVFLPVVGR